MIPRSRRSPGPETPWSELALAARPQLVSTARRVVRDHGEAEDVVDEAIARLATQIDQGEVIDSVVGWLHRAALRIAVDRARAWVRRHREAWQQEVTRRSAGAANPTADPAAALESVEMRERLWHAILELPDRQRDAIVLRQLEGLSYAKVAEHLDVAEGTARGHVHAARSALRATLRDLDDRGRTDGEGGER